MLEARGEKERILNGEGAVPPALSLKPPAEEATPSLPAVCSLLCASLKPRTQDPEPRAQSALRALGHFATLCAVYCLLCAGVTAAEPEPAAAAFAGAETCAGCHQAEYEEWQQSKHAGAFSPGFAAFWERRGKPPECLGCHTTGFVPEDRSYAFPGVSCEACHGPLAPDHPETPSMRLPTDVSVCSACHRQTVLEWQLSGHAQHGIRCFDCHAVHRQGLRQPEVEQQCGACHAQRLEDFAHATHHLQGLTCTTCHMPQPRTPGIGGTGAPAHSFFVGAETCAACHEEMVHTSHKISTLSEEVDRLVQTTDARSVEALQSQVKALELAMDLERSRAVKRSLALTLVGFLVGGLIVGLARRRRRS